MLEETNGPQTILISEENEFDIETTDQIVDFTPDVVESDTNDMVLNKILLDANNISLTEDVPELQGIVRALVETLVSLRAENLERKGDVQRSLMKSKVSNFFRKFDMEIMGKFKDYPYKELIESVISNPNLNDAIDAKYSELLEIIRDSVVVYLEELLDPLQIKAFVIKYFPGNEGVGDLSSYAWHKRDDVDDEWNPDPVEFTSEESEEYYESLISNESNNEGVDIISVKKLLLMTGVDVTTEVDDDNPPTPQKDFALIVCGNGKPKDTLQFLLKNGEDVLGVVEVVTNAEDLRNNNFVKEQELTGFLRQSLTNSFLVLEMLTNIMAEFHLMLGKVDSISISDGKDIDKQKNDILNGIGDGKWGEVPSDIIKIIGDDGITDKVIEGLKNSLVENFRKTKKEQIEAIMMTVQHFINNRLYSASSLAELAVMAIKGGDLDKAKEFLDKVVENMNFLKNSTKAIESAVDEAIENGVIELVPTLASGNVLIKSENLEELGGKIYKGKETKKQNI